MNEEIYFVGVQTKIQGYTGWVWQYVGATNIFSTFCSLISFSFGIRITPGFRVHYLKEVTSFQKMSPLAKQVLDEGKKLWQSYFAHTDTHTIREELKLNRPDVGWYQVRKALQARNASGDFPPISFKPFEDAYKALTEKLQPMVYELGFLKG